MPERPSFDREERVQVRGNARVVVVRLAEKAYTLFDELLRRTNSDLADFDPLGEQHKGDSEQEFEGLRPSYSRFWGGGFGFHAAVMEHQRVEMRRRRSDPTASNLLELVNRYVLTPGSDLVFAGADTPEINGILDFSMYQKHINGTNRQAAFTLKQVKRTLKNREQDYSDADDEREFVERAREAQREIPMALQIFAVMRTIRNWTPVKLQQLNQPMSDDLLSDVLQTALEETDDESELFS